MNDRIRSLYITLKRSYKYYYFKFIRQSGDPEYIARGVALGLFIGLLVPFGLQIAVVLPLAIWLKAAKIPSVVFTWVTNHFTIWIIYPVQCYIGSWVLASPFEYSEIRDTMVNVVEKQSFSSLFSLGWMVVASFFVGGVLFAVVTSTPGYFISLKTIKAYRRRKALKQQKNRSKYGVIIKKQSN